MAEKKMEIGERHGRRRDIVDDFNDLSIGCEEALDQALKDGMKKFPPGNWRRVGRGEHLAHAESHARAALAGGDRVRMRTHLAHLICRAAMAWWLLAEEDAR